MDEQDVIKRIERLREAADRPEHIVLAMERSIWLNVLCTIANGESDDPCGLAAAAIGTIHTTVRSSDTVVGEI